MVILDNGKYVVHIPEKGLWQDKNPANHGLPFASQQEAEDWQAWWLARQAEAKATADAAAISAKEAEEAARPKDPEPINPETLTETEFKRLVLKSLGYPVKEV